MQRASLHSSKPEQVHGRYFRQSAESGIEAAKVEESGGVRGRRSRGT